VGGRGYPAWVGAGGIAQAAEGALWVDPPVFPLLVAASFGVAGHFYHSVQIPIVLANVALPALLFVAFRALVGRDDIALMAVVGAVSSGVELQAARIRAKSAATAMSVPVFSVISRLSVGAAG